MGAYVRMTNGEFDDLHGRLKTLELDVIDQQKIIYFLPENHRAGTVLVRAAVRPWEEVTDPRTGGPIDQFGDTDVNA